MRHRPITSIASAVSLAAVLTLSACGSSDDEAGDDVTTTEAATDDATNGEIEPEEVLEDAELSYEAIADALDDPTVSTLFVALDAAGFDDLADAEAFTFFAPNDGASDAVDTELLGELLADPDRLQGILRNHVLDSVVMSSELPTDGSVTTTGGLELTFDTSGDTPTVNGIEIVRTDVTVDGGVIHVIDGLLLE